MFDIGGLEAVTLVVLAIIIFGPDKLPKAAAEAARMLRQVRSYAQNAREDIRRQLGPEFEDIDIADLNPKRFIRRNLLADDDLRFDSMQLYRDFSLDGKGLDDPFPTRRTQQRVQPGEMPPFDADAT
ncbi:Sec-independent protein translocase TatB [Carbonactinospora thermoautotrophica]|uniref:Sec-independent protein translocase protein TatB n=1 Tax=Carbonactinospora thermoautotrophica TaxID=1469144 RepID=A0A132NEP9_9ACTN|nr:sec-independent translocase [Carbonactinospora thermoautotrophica]KWW99276.1 Sec-independent protein translocase protein TatB [Carbonactinospora thermoautotrophica]KWX04956.1 hypothetical protein TH66_03985 [Carbonactinospora thermoautotrophica]KWX08591.1 hypothetical protein TR74_14315 [Carbonactinospora thermoautotrophica]MCX9192588.1 Sec-independent protein translocase TatB [Carbonactinospora thermoautotrophica]